MKIIRILAILFIAASLRASWVDAGGDGIGGIDVSNDPNYTSYIPSIAVDSHGHEHIAWYSNTPLGNTQVYYLYWDGYEWVDAAGSSGQESINISQTNTNAEYPRLVLDSLDRPHITWEDGAGNDREVYYLYWNGSAWADATGSGRAQINVSNMAGYSGHPAIALNSANRANIAWTQEEGSNPSKDNIYFARWNGVQWVGAVTNSPEKIYESADDSLYPYVCVDTLGNPHVTWSDGPDANREIYYLRYNGSAWVDATGSGVSQINISNTPLYSAWPKMALDSFNRPHIVWEDDDAGGQNIYYLHWNGSSWVDVTGSGTAAINVSGTYHYAYEPMIKLDKSDTPHVMWAEGAIETSDIMCVKWNGSYWSDESGTGTAFKRVFHDDINSEWPSFDLDPDGHPHIAWSDGIVYQEHDIFCLHWSPDGTPTITPTYKPGDTPFPTPSDTKTITPTLTITQTPTQTPIPVAVIFPNPCWADADGVGAADDPVSYGSKPVMKLDSFGRPNLAWVYGGSVYFMKWNGFAWVGADGAASGSRKISGTVFDSDAPDMVLDSLDRPHIAWTGFAKTFVK